MQWPLLPKFLDIYYHLSVVKGFADAGGYVTRAFWEYAPAGRPHLYPPLLHTLMLIPYKAGLPAITVGRLVDCFSYPLLLVSFYGLATRCLSPRGAFFSLLCLSSVFSVALASVTLSAFNLSVVLGLGALGFLHEKKGVPAGLCLALCFYAHTLGAALLLLTLVFYALLDREAGKAAWKAAVLALVLAAPFLAYQFRWRESFGLVQVHEFRRWEFDLALILLSGGGAVYFAAKKRLGRAALPLALIAGFSPLILTHPPRFFGGHGLIGPALLSGLFIDEFLKARPASRKGAAGVLLLIFFLLFLSPFFEWNFKEGKGRWVWADRTVTRYLVPDERRNFRAQGFSIFFPEDYEPIVRAVRENSGPDDILWTDFSYTAGILGILAGRATSCAMLAEVKPLEDSNRLTDARILVWFKDKDLQPTEEMRRAVEKYHFLLLQETEMAFVFQNPQGTARRQVPKPVLSTPVLLSLLALMGAGVFFNSRTSS